MKQLFRVYNTAMGDHVAVIEMDEALLAPDVGILDHDTMTLRGIKNGGMYTLLPVEHHTVATLKRVKQVYLDTTEKPAKYLSTHHARMDALLDAVGLMFGEIEYTLVESKEDLSSIINPHKDWEPKKVKYTVLGDLLASAEAEAGHVHGPGCGHDE